MTPVEAEREGCALLAEDLASRYEKSAARLRKENTTRFFGFGLPYTTIPAERDARSIDAAASGLRAVAMLIREGAASKALKERLEQVDSQWG